MSRALKWKKRSSSSGDSFHSREAMLHVLSHCREGPWVLPFPVRFVEPKLNLRYKWNWLSIDRCVRKDLLAVSYIPGTHEVVFVITDVGRDYYDTWDWLVSGKSEFMKKNPRSVMYRQELTIEMFKHWHDAYRHGELGEIELRCAGCGCLLDGGKGELCDRCEEDRVGKKVEF